MVTIAALATTTLHAMVAKEALLTRSVTIGSSPTFRAGADTGDRIALGIMLALTLALALRPPFVWRTGFGQIGLDMSSIETTVTYKHYSGRRRI